jgi:hypothetical protein
VWNIFIAVETVENSENGQKSVNNSKKQRIVVEKVKFDQLLGIDTKPAPKGKHKN